MCRLFTPNYQDLAHDVVLKVYNKLPKNEEEVKKFTYKVVKNTYINHQKKLKTVHLDWDVAETKQQQTKDPYNYIERLKQFRLKEPILGIALELYYLHDGNVLSIERDMKARNCSMCRQTLTKYIEEAKQKIKEL